MDIINSRRYIRIDDCIFLATIKAGYNRYCGKNSNYSAEKTVLQNEIILGSECDKSYPKTLLSFYKGQAME